MGLVAFKIEGAFGSRAVVGKHDAVVFGLLGREKGRACLFGQVLGDKVAVLGDVDRIAQGAGQSLVTGAYLVGGGEQVFVAGGRQGQSLLDARPAWMSSANTMYGLMQPSNARSLKRCAVLSSESGTVMSGRLF